jgi:hypothetical protein
MIFQTILYTFSTVAIAAVHSAPASQSSASTASVPSPFFTVLERRGTVTDAELERLRISRDDARTVFMAIYDSDIASGYISHGLFGLSRAALGHVSSAASLVIEADVQSASAPVSSPDITTSIDFDAKVAAQSAGEVV